MINSELVSSAAPEPRSAVKLVDAKILTESPCPLRMRPTYQSIRSMKSLRARVRTFHRSQVSATPTPQTSSQVHNQYPISVPQNTKKLVLPATNPGVELPAFWESLSATNHKTRTSCFLRVQSQTHPFLRIGLWYWRLSLLNPCSSMD